MELPLGSVYSTAYQIFFEELSMSVELFFSLMAELEESTTTERQESLVHHAPALKHRFHLLKGGAGFLRLERIAEYAGEGEQLFRSAPSRPAYVQAQLERLAANLGEEAVLLEQALAELQK